MTSVDVLFHLRREELLTKAEEAEPSGEPEVKDGMASLVRHVLGQRTFYPIFPPPEPHAGEVNLDVTHHPLLRMDGPAPDILIIPSKLKHFSKVSMPLSQLDFRLMADCGFDSSGEPSTCVTGPFCWNFCKDCRAPHATGEAGESNGGGRAGRGFTGACDLGTSKVRDLASLGRRCPDSVNICISWGTMERSMPCLLSL